MSQKIFLAKFAVEMVESSTGYFSGYCRPRSITEQGRRLREIFPGIGYADESLASLPVPKGAEGKFVIPPWQKVATTYGEAVRIVLDKLRVERDERFDTDLLEKLGAKHLRESAVKKAAFRKLGDEQRGFGLLVVDGQFGLLHRGRSVRCARVVMRDGEQFGFGTFENGVLLLTHPERLKSYNDLWIDCTGDTYSPEADGRFEGSLFFNFNDGCLALGADGVGCPYANFGTPSGFRKR